MRTRAAKYCLTGSVFIAGVTAPLLHASIDDILVTHRLRQECTGRQQDILGSIYAVELQRTMVLGGVLLLSSVIGSASYARIKRSYDAADCEERYRFSQSRFR